MNWKRALLAVVLLLFVEMTAVVLYQHGYAGFFELTGANSATQLMTFDLVICLTLLSIWMYRDARARGKRALPYILLALTFGAAGPLLYLVLRGVDPQPLARATGAPERAAAQS